MNFYHIWILYILLTKINISKAIIGYDCGGVILNVTTVSLLDIKGCEAEDIEPETANVKIQLLQLSDYQHTEVQQCKIEIDRTIYYCGMHSHVSIVQNGRREYIQETTAQSCKQMYNSGTFYFGNNAHINGITKNKTVSRSITLAGMVTTDGRCEGAQYSDPYGTWDKVVVQASIKITLRSFTAPIKYSSNEVILPSGTHCIVSKAECIDIDGSGTYWSPAPGDKCRFDMYDVLYDGLASKITSRDQSIAPIVYTVTTEDTTFSLARITEIPVCGYQLVQTEHPKLFIFELNNTQSFKSKEPISVKNLDIFTYMNSKFVYVERHMKTQLTQLYKDIIEQRCSFEKQILENALTLANFAPDEMAVKIMRSPGYTAITAGEVIHIIKCVPVQCTVRQVSECYDGLPVTYRNESLFLSPRTKILTRHRTPKECNDILPSMYRLQGIWYRQTEQSPKLIETIPPPTIQPISEHNWKYISPANLATSGIYSNGDLERLRNHIMFAVEKPSIINTLAKGATGERIPAGSLNTYNLFDEKSLEELAESIGSKVWHGFLTFGSMSAGVFAIFFILHIIKTVADTIIQGYALHSVYGCSIHLLGAIWGSITNLLLRLSERQSNNLKDDGYIRRSHEIDHSPRASTRVITRPPKGQEGINYTFKELRERHYDI